MGGRRVVEQFFGLANRLVAQSAAMGALPTLYAATAPGMVSGMLIGPDGPFEMRGYPQPTMPSRRAQDAALAGRLWELSESLDRKSTRLNSSHQCAPRLPSSAGK